MTLRHVAGGAPVAVIDLETTGVYSRDRVVEVGIVKLAPSGEVVGQYETLVNPGRDVGPTTLHGVTPAMVASAPTFAEIAGTVLDCLSGCAVVAHNATFDTRFLLNEYERLGWELDIGEPLCTMSLAVLLMPHVGRSLDAVCGALGIQNERAHAAIHDARVTAQVLLRYASALERFPVEAEPAPGSLAANPLPRSARTHRRDRFGAPKSGRGYLATLVGHLPGRAVPSASLAYLALLDEALADLHLDEGEREQLALAASHLGLSPEDAARLAGMYLDDLVNAALMDGVVTTSEMDELVKACVALDGDLELVRARIGSRLATGPSVVVQRPPGEGVPPPPPLDAVGEAPSLVLSPGCKVCFTGDWPGAFAGQPWSRALAHEVAARAGLEPIANVTKKCAVLVAADVNTSGAKARKARQYGIPVIDVPTFLDALQATESAR